MNAQPTFPLDSLSGNVSCLKWEERREKFQALGFLGSWSLSKDFSLLKQNIIKDRMPWGLLFFSFFLFLSYGETVQSRWWRARSPPERLATLSDLTVCMWSQKGDYLLSHTSPGGDYPALTARRREGSQGREGDPKIASRSQRASLEEDYMLGSLLTCGRHQARCCSLSSRGGMEIVFFCRTHHNSHCLSFFREKKNNELLCKNTDWKFKDGWEPFPPGLLLITFFFP